jgi:hypothetical protein
LVLAFAEVGVPVDGYPSAVERLQLVAINRVRADPNNPAKGTAHECSEQKEPRPPVLYDHDISQAARFHCTHLSVNGGGLSHQTFCTLRDDLESTACDGTAACSCMEGTECWNCDTLGGCGSGPSDRATIFGFPGGVAEVGAAGYPSGWEAVGGWTTENPCESTTLAHRDTLTGDYDVVGVGEAGGGSCWGTYQFADFASVEGIEIPAIPAAAVRGGFGTAELYANWYHPGGDPATIDAVVDGECMPMGIDLGAAGNATFMLMLPAVADGCHEFHVLAHDVDGNRITYPEVGALTFGTGCAGEYVAERIAATCEPSTDDGSVDEGPMDDGPMDDDTADAGSIGEGTDGADSIGGDDGGTSGGSGSDDANAGAGEDDEGCACRATAPGRGAVAFCFVVLAIAARRRPRISG